jgi:hypothetical protein
VFHGMLVEHGARHSYPVRDWRHFAALHEVFATRCAQRKSKRQERAARPNQRLHHVKSPLPSG